MAHRTSNRIGAAPRPTRVAGCPGRARPAPHPASRRAVMRVGRSDPTSSIRWSHPRAAGPGRPLRLTRCSGAPGPGMPRRATGCRPLRPETPPRQARCRRCTGSPEPGQPSQRPRAWTRALRRVWPATAARSARHQGCGSKSDSAALASMSHASSRRWPRPATSRRAAPLRAMARRNFQAVASPARSSVISTGAPMPSRVRPSRFARNSAPGASRRVRAINSTDPPSSIGAARSSSRAGWTSRSCSANSRRSACHLPVPAIDPAAAWPPPSSCTASCSMCRSSGWLGLPLSVARASRSGSRSWLQGPGRRFSIRT
jgi:hypothetical protein